jgi:hypothetical protein
VRKSDEIIEAGSGNVARMMTMRSKILNGETRRKYTIQTYTYARGMLKSEDIFIPVDHYILIIT